ALEISAAVTGVFPCSTALFLLNSEASAMQSSAESSGPLPLRMSATVFASRIPAFAAVSAADSIRSRRWRASTSRAAELVFDEPLVLELGSFDGGDDGLGALLHLHGHVTPAFPL